QQPGFGTHLTSLSGLTHLTGWPDRAPSLLWGPYIDYIAVAYGAVAVLAAIERRRQTGRGCHVDLSQLETGVQFLAPVLLDHFATGRTQDRTGNRDPAACPTASTRAGGPSAGAPSAPPTRPSGWDCERRW